AIEHPGAKNVVYNAPRFFPFSTAVLKEVTSNIFPSDSTVYDNEAASFISKNLASRNDTVLYMPITTKKGYETYLKLAGHPALKGFIMGHLTFDSTSKKITRSALVEAPISSGAMLFIDDDTIDIAMPSIPSYDGETTALNVFEGEGLEDENAIIYRTMMHEALAQLVKTRHASLNIISEDIVALLASYNRKPFEDFDEQYSLIEQRYKEEALTHHNIIEGALEKFFASYVKKSPYENFPVFKTVVESMSLHDYVSNSLYNDLNSLISDSTTTMSRVPHP
ncbi:MAG: hypothetical protein HN685_05655, partial [Waddliaceae bacterium]|nr:hypothetical protein [Waddliaceae bacterium]